MDHEQRRLALAMQKTSERYREQRDRETQEEREERLSRQREYLKRRHTSRTAKASHPAAKKGSVLYY